MESLVLLAKINTIFQICEKIAWGIVALWGVKTGIRYYGDYKESVNEDQMK